MTPKLQQQCTRRFKTCTVLLLPKIVSILDRLPLSARLVNIANARMPVPVRAQVQVQVPPLVVGMRLILS